jgi:predicted ribosomally synthesized peptide with SipW-like signal peptide
MRTRKGLNRRLALVTGSITTLAAVAALGAGVSLALFSASSAGSANTFTAGTVSIGSPTSTTCTVSGMEPGDESTGYSGSNVTGNTQATKDAACTFQVTYTGSGAAWIGLGTATSGTALYDGTSSGLNFQISDGASTSYTTSGVLNTNSSSSPLLVSATPDAGSGTGGDKTYTFTVNYGLPTAAGNAYQGKSTTLTLTVYAVQSNNNGYATTNGLSGGTACTAGSQCSGITGWS